MIEYSKRHGPEIPEPDYEDPKEVYAFYGLAAYWAQLIEQGITNLFVGLHIVNKQRPTWNDVKLLFESADRKTLGGLLTELRSFAPFRAELEQELSKALKSRNYLAHHFFVQHDEDFLHMEGRKEMIDELREIIVHFKDVDPQVDDLWLHLWRAYGITEERIERELAALKRALEEDQNEV